MPSKKPGPYVLVFILIIIIIFILGIRYGQKVEKTNKIIDFVASIPPTKPVPTNIPLEFKNYKNEDCGIRFLYPANLTIKNDSSISARFISNNEELIKIDCQKPSNKIESTKKDENLATTEVEFKKKKIIVNELNSYYSFKLLNQKKNIEVDITVEKGLFPLFESSYETL
jgi:hypothetical protein